jgi:hypothetical protein
MKVCVENQTLVEERVFLLERLLDLDHHPDTVPDFLSAVRHGSAGSDVFFIPETGAKTGTFLNEDLMACSCICAYIVGSEPHSEFIVLDFSYTSDFHSLDSFSD